MRPIEEKQKKKFLSIGHIAVIGVELRFEADSGTLRGTRELIHSYLSEKRKEAAPGAASDSR
jgi:hypothetical protein